MCPILYRLLDEIFACNKSPCGGQQASGLPEVSDLNSRIQTGGGIPSHSTSRSRGLFKKESLSKFPCFRAEENKLVELPFATIKGEKFQYLSSFTHLQLSKIDIYDFHVVCQVPPLELIHLLQKQQLLNLTFELGIMDLPLNCNKKDLIENLEQYFKVHPNLQLFSSFTAVDAKKNQEKSACKPLIPLSYNTPIIQHLTNQAPCTTDLKENIAFPPLPPSEALKHMIISDYCNDSIPEIYTESGCAVCGSLTPIKDSTPIKDVQDKLLFLDEYGIRHDTSANDPWVPAGKPVGKPAGYEYEWHSHSFPTGMWRVRVALFKLTGSGGCLLAHFSTELDVLRCVGKVLLTSFQKNRCCKIKTAWTAIIVSALIHVEVLISSLQILVLCAKLSAQMGNTKVCTSSK